EEVVESLRQNFPIYADNFTTFSQHTSAMHQFAIWTLLCDAGFGCSLQHYNPLIDNDIQKQWNLPTSWHLIAQMPFGVPSAAPTPKTTEDLDKRMMVLRG
ncbi:MAG: nitroreductase family protein, partial [Bacteroidales bacterium]|nr:nitroreductase family protein [Bacteroidales bacterium]